MTPSLLERTRHAEPAVLAFEAAARSIDLGVHRMAIGILAAIDDAPLRAHFEAAGDEWRRRHAEAASPYPEGVASEQRDPVRMPTESGQREIFERDLWHCRWCGTPVVSLSAVKRMHREMGPAYPHGGTNAEHHGLTLAAGASLDHVDPHALGGKNDAENFVTACWPCQFARGNDQIERIGLSDPRERAPSQVLPGWSGCSWFG